MIALIVDLWQMNIIRGTKNRYIKRTKNYCKTARQLNLHYNQSPPNQTAPHSYVKKHYFFCYNLHYVFFIFIINKRANKTNEYIANKYFMALIKRYLLVSLEMNFGRLED